MLIFWSLHDDVDDDDADDYGSSVKVCLSVVNTLAWRISQALHGVLCRPTLLSTTYSICV